jgi:hypothetical protein
MLLAQLLHILLMLQSGAAALLYSNLLLLASPAVLLSYSVQDVCNLLL